MLEYARCDVIDLVKMGENSFPVRFGKYILLDRLASGGMAEVFRAKVTGAENFQRLVAIKCMLPTLVRDPQFATMFVDEAKLASGLSHSNLVQIHELGKIDDRLYIVMELINGHDLRNIIRAAKKRNLPIPFGFTAYVIHKAGEGLDYAHAKTDMTGEPLELVHRDISPQNILVSYDGGVKVVDFGIAKAQQRMTETNAGVLKGKFAYMAPEQVMGASLDHRSDIFSLGIVLFELLTQKRLFQGTSDASVLEKVRKAYVPNLIDLVPSAPSEFEAIIKRALARNPDDRFSSAMEMAEALQPMLIENRTIFGAKQASSFMKVLYEAEIEHQRELFKGFAKMTWESCRESSGEYPNLEESFVYGSDFESGESVIQSGGYQMGGDGLTAGDTRNQNEGDITRGVEVTKGHVEDGSQNRIISRVTPLPKRVRPRNSTDLSALDGAPSRVTAKFIFTSFITMALVLVAAAIYLLKQNNLGIGQRTVITEIMPVQVSEKPPPASEGSDASNEKNSGDKVVDSVEQQNDARLLVPDGVSSTGGKETKGVLKRSSSSLREPTLAAYGYISIKAEQASRVKIYINNKDVGYSPVAYYRVALGEVSIRLVEEGQKQPYRVKRLKAIVTTSHTRAKPKKLFVQF